MRLFVCLLDSNGIGISPAVKQSYEALPRARGLQFMWQSYSYGAVLTAWDDPYGASLVAEHGDHVAVGAVRLDNRAAIEGWTGIHESSLSDLDLVLHMMARYGAKCIPWILGDFAFVIWHGATRTAFAATDALGVRKLYYVEGHGLIAFASRAEALALEERYDVQYLAELLALCPITVGLTAFANVRRLPAATSAILDGDNLTLHRYWLPEEFEETSLEPGMEREAPEALRELLAESVRHCLSGNGDTWAQLSGGLDSSSIVSMTEWLTERGTISHGLAGTVTYVDCQDTDADEREYSDAVVDRWKVRNETIVDPPFWLDDHAPPQLDQPRDSLAFYPRERRLCAVVRGAGGRVLLTGFGSDEVFSGTTLFFADWLAQGRVWATARELARWAATGRVSFWQLAWGNALQPLLPLSLRSPRSFEQGRLLPWISPLVDRRYGLQKRVFGLAVNTARTRRKYYSATVAGLNGIMSNLDSGALGDTLDVRYPFLYRPLVEFGLRLPPELCARPQARKWVLREAMRGILPEIVRARVGKGAPTDVLVRSLTHQRSLLEPLVHDTVLATLGVVDEVQLRAAFELAHFGAGTDHDLCTHLQNTLMAEAWLRSRSGRWPQGSS